MFSLKSFKMEIFYTLAFLFSNCTRYWYEEFHSKAGLNKYYNSNIHTLSFLAREIHFQTCEWNISGQCSTLILFVKNCFVRTGNLIWIFVRNIWVHKPYQNLHQNIYPANILLWTYKTTNVMHWILFIRQILLLSSTCFEYQVLIFRRT